METEAGVPVIEGAYLALLPCTFRSERWGGGDAADHQSGLDVLILGPSVMVMCVCPENTQTGWSSHLSGLLISTRHSCAPRHHFAFWQTTSLSKRLQSCCIPHSFIPPLSSTLHMIPTAVIGLHRGRLPPFSSSQIPFAVSPPTTHSSPLDINLSHDTVSRGDASLCGTR